MELKGKKVNFLGDSITEGVGTSCEEGRYTCVLAELAELGEIRNYGISGTRIANQHTVSEAIDTLSFCQRYDEMDNDACVYVLGGKTRDAQRCTSLAWYKF